MIFYILNLLLTVYSWMLLIRVLGSWIPEANRWKWMRFLGFYVDPYLNFFRKIIPPLGMIDLSPIAAFFALQILKWILFSIFR